MGALSFDTTFLIDLQRERREGGGPAHDFLRAHRDEVAYLSVVAYGEYAEGFSDRSVAAFLSVVESFELLSIDRTTADRYAEVARELRCEGKLIGANDLWIATVALQHDLPVVTANEDHFSRVPGLRVVGYRSRPPGKYR